MELGINTTMTNTGNKIIFKPLKRDIPTVKALANKTVFGYYFYLAVPFSYRDQTFCYLAHFLPTESIIFVNNPDMAERFLQQEFFYHQSELQNK